MDKKLETNILNNINKEKLNVIIEKYEKIKSYEYLKDQCYVVFKNGKIDSSLRRELFDDCKIINNYFKDNLNDDILINDNFINLCHGRIKDIPSVEDFTIDEIKLNNLIQMINESINDKYHKNSREFLQNQNMEIDG
ncbi:hypothetical protein SGLAD_v1c08380 [Spiroplasma gladiatoris]|uniref:Uncharacterized protein n=1 Tax=Spiroplasma gladiatoris TaxID=2143 RepID=A0A4P7AID4_9MOLU|nr:hypothetical protein [Spiroplasma gladiatoris]QBQ08037.1 hypothetical protein SGLAD_v1c08380 [Spiroplasma gladiatoris]